MSSLNFDPSEMMSNAIYQALLRNFGEDRTQKILEAALIAFSSVAEEDVLHVGLPLFREELLKRMGEDAMGWSEDRWKTVAAFALSVVEIKGEHLAVKKPVSKN